jgi:hypothetical protein
MGLPYSVCNAMIGAFDGGMLVMLEELVKGADGRFLWRRVLENGKVEEREATPEEIDAKEVELEE